MARHGVITSSRQAGGRSRRAGVDLVDHRRRASPQLGAPRQLGSTVRRRAPVHSGCSSAEAQQVVDDAAGAVGRDGEADPEAPETIAS